MEAQRKLFDLAVDQIGTSVKAGRNVTDLVAPFPRVALADLTRDTVETFVAAQKALLDIVVKPRHVAVAAGVSKAAPKPKRPRTRKAVA